MGLLDQMYNGMYSSSGPISDYTNQFNPYGVSSMTWDAQNMPTFSKEDFVRYLKPGLYGNGSESGASSDVLIGDPEEFYRKNIYKDATWGDGGWQDAMPKTFAEFLATDPYRSLAEGGGYISGPKTINDWLAQNTTSAFNRNSPLFSQGSPYSIMPQNPNNFLPLFNDAGEFTGWREKTDKRQGTEYGYSFDPATGKYVPNGQVSKGYWNTNNTAANLDMLRFVATALGGAALGSAVNAAGAAGAAGGAGAGAGATASGLGGLEAASAGTPIAIGGAEGLTMSSLPALGETAAGSGGILGAIKSGASNMGITDWMKLGTATLGGIAGMQGAGAQSATQTKDVPPQLQGLLGDVAIRAKLLGNMPFTPYGGQMVAGFNPDQLAAFNQIRQQAEAGSPMLQNAQQAVSDTASGKFLEGNPYLDPMIKQTQDDLQNRFGSTLLGSGSFGNANVAQQGFQGMADAANKLRYQNYDTERARQMQAANMAPGMFQAGMLPGQALMGIGGTQQQQQQNVLNAQRSEFDRAQEWPFKQYQALSAPFGLNVGGSTTTTQPGTSRTAGLLGGALAAGQLYNTWFGGK